MDVFNKIYSQVSSSVSSTVSQLSGVLPGNPVTREFDASSHIASGGPGLLWKIYKGTKRSTKQEASIFVFEKKQLDRYNKNDKEIVLEVLRRGVLQLTKIRHPQILTVQHPLEESRESLAFATEPVFASLANILGDTYNMPQVNSSMTDYKFYDIEIKYGLLQIGEGLAFLHNDVKLLHKNISPESIMINQQGAWKIFGFDFCVHNTSPPNAVPFYPYEEYSPVLPQVAQPNLDFMAPECILTQSHVNGSDIFSLGMVAFMLHSPNHQPISKVKDIQQFRARIQQMKQLSPNKLQCVPEALREYVKMMLNVTPDVRPDAHQFIKIPYFEDVGVKTLNYLDSLLQWDNLQKSQFYKGLPEALSKLPHRVCLQRVLPCLVRDLQQPAMVPFVLPSIMDIAQNCTQQSYIKCVLPYLKAVMKLTEPVQILLIFLQRMELLLKQTPAEDVQQHVLPMLYRGLDSETPKIHELCLTVLPTFAGLLDHANVKNSLLPRIKKLCLGTGNLSVRVNCLLCIGRILENLDKWLVLDEILPFLPQIPSREPAVLMGILGIYKLALNHKKLGISKEIIATRILPFLMPLCIENGLSLAQFNALVALVKQMFQMVESEHRVKLEQLNTVQQERKALESTMPQVNPQVNMDLNQAFSGLGLDNFAGGSMSLQEKKSLVQQQNSMKLLQEQAPLEPKIPKPQLQQQQQQNTIKDLSADLRMSNSFIPQIASPPQQQPKPMQSQPFSLNTSMNAMPKPAAFNNQNFNNNSFGSLGMNMSNPTATNHNWNNNANYTGWSNTNTNNSNNKNWSALDSLIPASSNSKTSMNQMMLQSPQDSNKTKNALSPDEIMDLLS